MNKRIQSLMQRSLVMCMQNRMSLYGCHWRCKAVFMRHFCSTGNDNQINTMSSTLSLPAPSGSDNVDAEKVTMMRFDTLGPAVVTENGKVRFFEDWEGKTEKEKEDILKIVIPRNQKRLAKLRQIEFEEQHVDEVNSTTNNSNNDNPT